MEELWRQFDRIVVFDTETTGIEFGKDRIIELGAVSLEAGTETDSLDALIRLPEGRTLPPFIVELTGITDAQLRSEGVEQEEAAEDFCRLLEGCERPLLVAYNAQFDLNFLYHFLRPCGRVAPLSGRADGVSGPAGLPPQALQRHRGIRPGGHGGEQPPGGGRRPGHGAAAGGHGGGAGRHWAIHRSLRHPSQVRPLGAARKKFLTFPPVEAVNFGSIFRRVEENGGPVSLYVV